MTHQLLPREASPRAIEGSSALSSPARGRPPAPRVSPWFPILTKVGCAVLAAGVLAVVGARTATPSPLSGDGAPPALLSASMPTPVVVAAPTAPPDPVPKPADARADPSPGIAADGRIILNAASEDELTKLPGIGPSRARAIVALRQRLAKFRAVEDLLRVKGIGRKTLQRIKPNVVLDRPPVADAGAASTIG